MKKKNIIESMIPFITNMMTSRVEETKDEEIILPVIIMDNYDKPITCYFVKGMSWGELVNSEYNTLKLVIEKVDDTYQIRNSEYDFLYSLDEKGKVSANIFAENVISENIVYKLAGNPK